MQLLPEKGCEGSCLEREGFDLLLGEREGGKGEEEQGEEGEEEEGRRICHNAVGAGGREEPREEVWKGRV